MNELKKFLLAFFGPTLKMDDAKITELLDDKGALKTEAVSQLLAADATRIKTITDDLKDLATKQNNEGYAKGKGEALGALETELKATYGLQGDQKGLELVKAIVTGQLEKSGKKGEVTEDQVLKHPLYLTLQDKLKVETERISKEWDDKWKSRDEQDQQRSLTSEVREYAGRVFDQAKPVLSTDPARAAEQKRLFVEAFLSSNKFIKQNDKFIPLDEAGKPKLDQHGYLNNFDTDFLARLKGTYDIQVSDPKGTPPPPGGAGAPPPGGLPPGDRAYASLGLKAPANQDDFVKGWTQIEKMPDEKARVSAQTHWSQDFQKTKSE